MAVRISAGSISVIGRATQGVRLIRLSKGDRLISLAMVPPEEAEEGEEGEAEPGGIEGE